VRFTADDVFEGDAGHYDLIGPDAPVVKASAKKSSSDTFRGQVLGMSGMRGNDAGYETLPVDEPYDTNYSPINERTSKSKSG